MIISDALIQSETSRFRVIFLTTMTTVCGLLPLLTETAEQAQYLIQAVISLAFGELFATPIKLCLVPFLIKMANNLTLFFGFTWKAQLVVVTKPKVAD
jgi:multidrug efflux pump subunit AcrB